MPEAEEKPKRGRRYGVIFVAVIAFAFTGSSAYQIVTQCFDLTLAPKAPPDDCTRGIRTLEAALDHASGKASAERDEVAVMHAWDVGLLPEWSLAPSIETTCNATPEGAQAYVSLLRLRHAHEGLLRRRGAEVKSLRESLEAQLAPR